MRAVRAHHSGSQSIDSEEFFEMLGEARSPFTDALFQLIDLDGSGTIEFEEYVLICGTYCMYTKEDILKCAFESVAPALRPRCGGSPI